MSLFEGLDESSLKLLQYSNDPVAFTKDIIGLKCEWFHQEWMKAFETNRFNVLLAPRGHGKTSIVGSYIIWRISTNRNIRALIVTINQDKANSMMTFIQENLENNRRLTDLFGAFKKPSLDWSRDQIRVRQTGDKYIPHNEPTLKVLGVSSRVISAHYDLIVLDDITDDDNSRTQHRREMLQEWYEGPLIGTFMAGTNVINIGTRWNQDDFHSYLMDKAGYHTLKYQAVQNLKKADEGTEPYKVLWDEHLPWDKDMIKEVNKRILSENRPKDLLDENALTLKFIREHQGERFFQMQYQNNIIASGISKFKPEWIDKAISKWKSLNGLIPVNTKKYIGVDWGGEENVSDWGVTTVIGVDPEGNIYIIDYSRTHASPKRQLDIMKSIDEKYTASRIGMDAAAQQKYLVTDASRQNPNIPIMPIKPSRVNDKDTRADRLSILFETNRVYLNPSLTHLVDELRVYPRGKWDDCIDSLSFALEASESGGFIDWSRTKDVLYARSTKGGFSKI